MREREGRVNAVDAREVEAKFVVQMHVVINCDCMQSSQSIVAGSGITVQAVRHQSRTSEGTPANNQRYAQGLTVLAPL